MSDNKRKLTENETVMSQKKKQKVLNKCEIDNCNNNAQYGEALDIKKKRCFEHKFQNDVKLDGSKICNFAGCKTQACYGNVDKIKMWCAKHKTTTCINVTKDKCFFDGCYGAALYSQGKTEKPTRCSKHKVTNDVNYFGVFCQQVGCQTVAHYGDPKERKRLRCMEHKLAQDVNLDKKNCEFNSCKSSPSFGTIDNIPLRCGKHKLDTDINLNQRICEYKNCALRAYYAKEGEKIALRCVVHRKEEDESKTSKRCCFKGCKACPSFGNEKDWVRKRCAKHKLETDVCLNKNFCVADGCETWATFGPVGEHAARCSRHKLENDESKLNKLCKTEGCPKYSKNDEGFCIACHPNFIKNVPCYSKESCKFIDAYSKEIGREILHAHYDCATNHITGKEFSPPCLPKQRVDGYFVNEKEKVVVEYLGSIWHGHPKLWEKDEDARNFKSKILYSDLYFDTLERFKVLKANGFTIMYIWDLDLKKKKKNDPVSPMVRKFEEKLEF